MGMGYSACSRCEKRRRLRHGLCRKCRAKEYGPDAADAGADVAEAMVEAGAFRALGRMLSAFARALAD
ncbi:hypothetical protein [Streptomyces sp. cmx-18-6]|uniref:hypothetical protein n=1 Tax=Streptomyces sp. cmx-18-6 TaxID=2790930 RepID=UPI0039802451